MTRRFVLRRQAEQDIRSAFEWCESERTGLGEEFRRTVVSRFPYVIFHLALPDKVTVLAVLHQYRSPTAWPRRGRAKA